MPSSESEHVTCPDCGKAYRWQPALVGKTLPCKQCGTTFEIPDQPGKGVVPKPADDGLYELAADPDDEPDLPPAYTPPPSPPDQQQADTPVKPVTDTGSPAPTSPSSETAADAPSEPEVHISEEAKASRREEQRIAAAQSEAERSWRDYKWLIILLAALLFLGILYWAMYAFSDAMEDGLHNTMLSRPAVHAHADASHQGELS